MVHVRKTRRGRQRWASGDPVIHRQVQIGPFIYADRELFGLRLRIVYLFGKKLKSWRVK